MNTTTISLNQQGRQIATQLRKKLPTYNLSALPNNEWALFIDGVHCGGFVWRSRWVWIAPEDRTVLGCPANWRDEVKDAVLKAIAEVENG